jgi:hypothetical protein
VTLVLPILRRQVNERDAAAACMFDECAFAHFEQFSRPAARSDPPPEQLEHDWRV